MKLDLKILKLRKLLLQGLLLHLLHLNRKAKRDRDLMMSLKAAASQPVIPLRVLERKRTAFPKTTFVSLLATSLFTDTPSLPSLTRPPDPLTCSRERRRSHCFF